MHPAFEIESKIRAYVDHKLTLNGLLEWFRPVMGILLGLPVETNALELATALQLSLIEYRAGGYTERQIRQHLRKALP